MNKPVVSVLMLTYNHEAFIRQALESAIVQDTTYSFEIVIGDDGSTDKTREILQEYKKKHPQLIRLLFHKKNLKPVHNLMAVHRNCKGKYIALLEGDDYWSSPKKLQKQVDFLDAHPSFAICYHYTKMIDKDGNQLLLLPIEKYRKPKATIKDLAENDSFMATCSTMYRNNLFKEFPPWFKKLTYIADFPLNILNAQHGDIGLINKVMSVYRSQSSAAAFSAQSHIRVHEEKLLVFTGVNKELRYKYNEAILDRMGGYYFTLAKAYFEKQKIVIAKKYYKMYSQRYYKTHYISLMERILFPLKLKLWELRNIV